MLGTVGGRRGEEGAERQDAGSHNVTSVRKCLSKQYRGFMPSQYFRSSLMEKLERMGAARRSFIE